MKGVLWKPPLSYSFKCQREWHSSNVNGTLVDSNSDKEIVLEMTRFHDEEILDKQNLTDCDHSESHLNEEVDDGRIKLANQK